MNYDFSIIIPVYNSEKYLEKCLQSILNQGDFNYEVLLINDGSTDGSLNICNRFAEKCGRIKVFTQENSGLCAARNKGIDNAEGRYFLFIDNDDEIAENTLSVLNECIQANDYDVIRFNRKRVQIFPDGKQKTDVYGTRGICENGRISITKEDFFKNYRKYKKSGCFSGIWNALFSRKMFDSIRFDTGITAGYEDFLVNIQVYDIAEKMLFIPDVLYTYFRRSSHSTSTKYRENQIYALKKAANAEKQMLIHHPEAQWQEIYNSDSLYLGQIIKVLVHPNCPLTIQEKTKIIENLKQEPAFQFEEDWMEYVSGKKEKAYLSLFVNGHYKLLYIVSKFILRLRNNT